MAQPLPESVDTCIIGNGPSALILSYILHGHIPYYRGHHQDELLHSKLRNRLDLLNLSPDLYEHFQSSLRYSTQALPVNTLLDTLLRPNADTEINPVSLIEWRSEPHRAVSHVVLGHAATPGGQWVENPVSAGWDIGTLSYAEMLSLPGYSYAEHYHRKHSAPLPDFQRPSRAEVADYYAAYPAATGLSPTIRTSIDVTSVSRGTTSGFNITTNLGQIKCKHLVLATGIFSRVIQPPPSLAPLSKISNPELPLLVIGSGFSAADIIVSTPAYRKIIHVFNWDPESHPSPLKGCHHQAYPEYAGIYRQMKLAALASSGRRLSSVAISPLLTKKKNAFSFQRNWETTYEGMPNAKVLHLLSQSDESAVVEIERESGQRIERCVGGLGYVVGRRGSLEYLERSLLDEVVGAEALQPPDLRRTDAPPRATVSSRTFRSRARLDLELAPNVFIIGSLTGDSLVRHAFGGCVYAAGRIMGHPKSSPSTPRMNGTHMALRANGAVHEDLHLDRRKLAGA